MSITLPNNLDLYNWYRLNGCPNRDAIRKMDDGVLPYGASRGLLESLLPYFTNLDKSSKTYINNWDIEKDERSIVVASDFHIPFHDVGAMKIFFNFLQEYQPDELVLNGNINDCWSFSSHPKLRELANVIKSAKEEVEKWLPIAEYMRDILPNTKITYIGSQCHEGWIDKWASLSPITLEDERYTIKNWFRLDDFLIDFEKEVYDPIGGKEILITHGTVARGTSGASARATMDMEGTSIIMGHTHRLSQIYKTTSVGETVGIECGCLCQRTPWYTLKGRRLMMDWQQGFVLLNVKGNSFSTQCIPIIRDSGDRPYFYIGKEIYK